MTTRSPRGRIGSTIRDKYRVETFLATGSMANVYAAAHRNGGRVALKILHRELASDPQMRERFKREGYFCNAIEHPGIPKAIDDDVTEDDCPFIVMELLEGENLEMRRKRVGGRLPLGEVLTIADGVLDVLSTAHRRAILHRDLKPENVFLTHDGAVKLLDFGVARWNDGKQTSEVTGVGMVLGTPAFMPPEQALGVREQVDARSDIWALGATLFTMLTGESVHTGDTAKAKLVATATKPARKLSEVMPNLPSAVTAVIDRALEYHREDRWADATAMREALRWARMSLDPEAEVMTSSSPMVAASPAMPAATTRREKAFATDDEPTVMRQMTSATPDEVYTSAPQITPSTTVRATIPDDIPPAMSESGESIAFSLRNDPVFSLRRAKESDADAPPRTQRLPGAVDDDLGLPPLVEEPPMSEDVHLDYTRPMMTAPTGLGLRGTLPLPAGTTTSPSKSFSAITNAPPSGPRMPSAPPSNAANHVLVAPSWAASSGLAAKIALSLLLVAMLAGTVVVVRMKKQADARTTASASASTSAMASASAAPVDSASTGSNAVASASTGADPAPVAEAPSAASAQPPTTASASASAGADTTTAAQIASAEPVATAKPKPRPKPAATATATPTASTAPAETSEAPTTTAVPVPLPTPTPKDESP